jgi:hypothetical protein
MAFAQATPFDIRDLQGIKVVPVGGSPFSNINLKGVCGVTIEALMTTASARLKAGGLEGSPRGRDSLMIEAQVIEAQAPDAPQCAAWITLELSRLSEKKSLWRRAFHILAVPTGFSARVLARLQLEVGDLVQDVAQANAPSSRGAMLAPGTLATSSASTQRAEGAVDFSGYAFDLGKRSGKPTRSAAIAIDTHGNVFVAGRTQGDFPTTAAAQKRHGGGINDAFVAKLAPDGQLLYSTYLGGREVDFAEGVAVDAAGNAYVAGTTYSRNFPTSNTAAQRTYGGGDRDCFVAKLGPDGSLLYSTLLGGDSTDRCMAVAVDGEGNAYVTGSTNSTDFVPSKTGGSIGPRKDWDVFVAKLDATGTRRLFTVRFGGTAGSETKPGGLGGESGTGIAIGPTGTMYVSGYTDSEDFPTLGAAQPRFGGGTSDGFIVRIDASGKALLASTYLGGTGSDSAVAIKIDPSGSVYVTGSTQSPDFPTKNALFGRRDPDANAFVSKLTSSIDGLVYSTYLSGGSSDIAVDALGLVYLIGTASGFASMTAINAAGDSILFSKRLARAGGVAIAVDLSGRIGVASNQVGAGSGDHVVAVVWLGKTTR